MTTDEFRINHSKIIEQYQLIEWHLEGIFGLLESGDFEELTHRVENDAMGELIRKVRFLIKENKVDLLTKEDFSILDNIRDDRNFWCHNNFLDIQEDREVYKKQTQRIIEDLNTVVEMNDKLKNVFIKLRW